MTCFHPKYIYLRGFYPSKCPTDEMLHDLNKPKMRPYPGFYAQKVPCGKCIGCILDHANEWATRCAMETSYWENACFITLTYDSNLRNGRRTGGQKYKYNLPMTEKGKMTLCQKDFTDFMKRLRKKYEGIKGETTAKGKEKFPIRYFCCGEYGPENGRPHYHAILFNWKPKDLKFKNLNHKKQPLYISPELAKIWGHGFVIIGEANYETACYVARYVTKKWGDAKKEIETYYSWDKKKQKVVRRRRTIKGEVEPEFITMSRNGGIGLRTFYAEFDKIKRNNGYIIKGKVKKICKLFKKKWEEMNWQEYHQWRFEEQKRGEKAWKELIDKYITPQLNEQQKEEWILKEQERILLQKVPKLRRTNIIEALN